MRAIDTNVLVRLIARDHAEQTEAAEAFVARGAWVSHLVLAETVWVLESVYGFEAGAVANAVDMLLHHAQIVVQDSSVAAAALAGFRRRAAAEFSDCLNLEIARRSGCLPLGTFDRALGRMDAAERIGKS